MGENVTATNVQVQLHSRYSFDEVVDVLLAFARAHPRVGVGFSRVAARGDGNGGHPIGQRDALGLGVGRQLGDPPFQAEPVVDYEVRLGAAPDVFGAGLEVVDLLVGAGDGLDLQAVSRDRLRHV